jgi:flagellar biosynthesis anti-sigma factor FlgM
LAHIFSKKLLFFSKLADIVFTTVQQGVANMEIKGSDIQSKLNVYQSAQVQGKKMDTVKSAKPEASTPQQDRVALSGRGQSIADAQRAMTAVPDVRESLVYQIQNDLQNGTYVVDNQKAAEGLLRESMVNQAALV